MMKNQQVLMVFDPAMKLTWTPRDAIALAHAAGFVGTSWVMGPEELAHVLNVLQKPPNVELEAAPSLKAPASAYLYQKV